MSALPNESSRVTVPPGTRLGRYEVITQIASGGMATVYLGRALGAAGFQRLVAIKCLHPHVAQDDEFVAMFMDEARLAARLRHPNVVPTLDLENGADGLFLVMEFVEGDGLLGLLRAANKARKPIPPGVAVRIVLDTLNGLHAAHELTGDRAEPLRIVHRDISPHNILVGVDGISRITDFGIARAEERMTHTRDGQIKGKLAYMAPEQTTNAAVDRRADLFSTGVVLWESLAGRRLFTGTNDGEVLRNLIVNPIPRLRDVAPELPAELDEVCHRALSRDPDGRFATASQFAEALEQAAGSIGIGSARAVAQLVREHAGPKIEAMHEQVRAITGDPGGSAVRAVGRRRELTDPDKTVPRADLSSLGAAEAMRAAGLPVQATNGLSSQVAVPAPPYTPASPPVPAMDLAAVPGPRRRSPVVPIAIAVVLLLAGVGGALVFLRGGDSAQAPAPQSANAPMAAPPAAPMQAPQALVPAVPPAPAEPAPSAPTAVPAAPVAPPSAPSDMVFNEPAPSPAPAGNTGTTRAPVVRRAQPARPAAPVRRPGNAPATSPGGFNPEAM